MIAYNKENQKVEFNVLYATPKSVTTILNMDKPTTGKDALKPRKLDDHMRNARDEDKLILSGGRVVHVGDVLVKWDNGHLLAFSKGDFLARFYKEPVKTFSLIDLT